MDIGTFSLDLQLALVTEFKQDIEMNLLPKTYRSRALTDNTIGAPHVGISALQRRGDEGLFNIVVTTWNLLIVLGTGQMVGLVYKVTIDC